MTSGFQLERVSVRRDDHDVLIDVDVIIPDGGITIVAGPSASGKSSLLRLLNRLDDPSAGRIRWRDDDLAGVDPRSLRRRVGMVFQQPVLFEGSVADNLRTVKPSLADGDVADALAAVALAPELADRDAGALSVGEGQRLCLARALTTAPEVVLADEPTASLDTESRARLEELALGMPDVGWIWVTHDVDQIKRLADHVVVVDGGRVTACGTLDELMSHPDERVRRALTGDPS